MRLLRESAVSFARGVNDARAPTEYLGDELARLVNGHISAHGNAIERRDGSRRSHSTALNSGATIYGGIEFYTAAGAQQLVVFAGDKMYYSTDVGATWTEGASGLREDWWSLKIIREGSANVLCCANGGANSYQWNGVAWGTISNIPSGTSSLEVLGERLVAAGGNGVTVTASKVNDIDNGYGATAGGWSVRATTHDGDTDVRGLFVIGSVLLVFKRKSVGYIEGFGYQTLQVETGARGLTRSFGLAASRSLAPVGDQGVAWLSERGFEAYFLGGAVVSISRQQQDFIDTAISWDFLQAAPGLATAFWWTRPQLYWCSVPCAVAQNTKTFVYRPPSAEQPGASWLLDHTLAAGYTIHADTGYLEFITGTARLLALVEDGYLSLADSPGATGLYVSVTAEGYLELHTANHDYASLFIADHDLDVSAPWAGGYDGFIRKLEYDKDGDNVDSTGAGGEDILMSARTRPLMFGDQFTRKKAKRITVNSSQGASASITVRAITDGDVGDDHVLSFSAASDLSPEEQVARVGGKGRILQIEAITTDDARISGMEMVAALMDDQL